MEDDDKIKTIMVVEDEQWQRLNICDMINDEGMEVVPMANGVKAKSYLLDNLGVMIDLILLDYNMPVMDGYEFLLWLREMQEFKDIVVIMMSTQEEMVNLHNCIQIGATDYFIKPVTKQVIRTLPKLLVELKSKEPADKTKKTYEKISDLGAGGNAKVELVWEKNSKTEFARKIISIAGSDESVLRQAKNEVELFKLLDSPFILKYIESYSRGESLYIIMEYAKNGELHNKIQNQRKVSGKKFPQALIIKWLTQCSLGLALMHSKSIMHRDLKPQNLFLNDQEDLKIGDFGISKEIKTTDRLTNTFCGTPYYMPPEIYRRESYSTYADIWALGCTFYETMTLEKPFGIDANETEGKLQEKIETQDPLPPLSQMYSEPLRKLVMAMLNKRPQDRPTITEVLRSDVVMDCISEMIKDNKELEQHILMFTPLEKQKRTQKGGNQSLNSQQDSFDKEKALKFPELVVAGLMKHLELKTIKNGFISKLYNAFTGADLLEAFPKAKFPAANLKAEEFMDQLITLKYLLVLKGDQSKFHKDSVYTWAYVQDLPIKNDLFEPQEQIKDLQNTVNDLMICAREVVKVYRESYLNRDDSVFNPFTWPDFLLFLRLMCSLKQVKIIDLTKNERMAYFLNCFQLLSFHRLVLEASGSSQKAGLLSYVGLGKGSVFNFKLGFDKAMVFSAEDILHGVLRKNTKKASAYFAQFKGGDPRSTLIGSLDNRIILLYYLEHCELQAVFFERFEPTTYETKLTSALKAWTAQNMYYNYLEKTIILPSYLESNYLPDFNSQEFDMVLFVVSAHPAHRLLGRTQTQKERPGKQARVPADLRALRTHGRHPPQSRREKISARRSRR